MHQLWYTLPLYLLQFFGVEQHQHVALFACFVVFVYFVQKNKILIGREGEGEILVCSLKVILCCHCFAWVQLENFSFA